jgi:hypothetical protein
MKAIIKLLVQLFDHARFRHAQGERILAALAEINSAILAQSTLLERIAAAQEADADGGTPGLSDSDRAAIVAGTTSLRTSAEELAAANSAAEPPVVESPQP